MVCDLRPTCGGQLPSPPLSFRDRPRRRPRSAVVRPHRRTQSAPQRRPPYGRVSAWSSVTSLGPVNAEPRPEKAPEVGEAFQDLVHLRLLPLGLIENRRQIARDPSVDLGESHPIPPPRS